MILPGKHLRPERSLIGIGGDILGSWTKSRPCQSFGKDCKSNGRVSRRQ